MSKLLKKPTEKTPENIQAKFEKFNLKENPFPSEPVVNKDSQDKRINGDIYEQQIRTKEYDQILNTFIKQSQSDPNHHRLGYIIDTSYIGRGNGKSAFLVNLQNKINKEYCLDLTNEMNKCFSIYVTPEPGGRTKTFSKFIDSIFIAIIKSGVIKVSIGILRLEALYEIYPETAKVFNEISDEEIIENLNDLSWFENHNIKLSKISEYIINHEFLDKLPSEFPLIQEKLNLSSPFITQDDFIDYYTRVLKRKSEKHEFIFTDLVRLFLGAGFNGAYVLVDDFERIPDFQSARQKKDFALELRSVLFDGLYLNSKIGFYNILLVLHAGVPRLISDAWAESGMENRAPISPPTSSKHVIHFGKLNKEHAKLLIQKYLEEYRLDNKGNSSLYPFTEGAISVIGQLSEYNAAKILKMAYDLLDKAVQLKDIDKIDEEFVEKNKVLEDSSSEKYSSDFSDIDSENLVQKALGKN